MGIGRNNKPGHSIVFWLETFNPVPIYLPTDNLSLIFESFGDILSPRALRYAFGRDRNCLLRSIMVDLVSETEFVGSFYRAKLSWWNAFAYNCCESSIEEPAW